MSEVKREYQPGCRYCIKELVDKGMNESDAASQCLTGHYIAGNYWLCSKHYEEELRSRNNERDRTTSGDRGR